MREATGHARDNSKGNVGTASRQAIFCAWTAQPVLTSPRSRGGWKLCGLFRAGRSEGPGENLSRWIEPLAAPRIQEQNSQEFESGIAACSGGNLLGSPGDWAAPPRVTCFLGDFWGNHATKLSQVIILMQSSESKPGSKNRNPAPQKTQSGGHGVTLRLFSLIAMFFLVLYLMMEARKPENWLWMGFEQEGQQENGPADGNGPRDNSEVESRRFPGEPAEIEMPLEQDPGVPAFPGQSAAGHQEQADFDVQLKQLQAERQAVEMDFWKQAYARLDLQQQKHLFQLLRFVEDEYSADTKSLNEFRAVLELLTKWSSEYQAKIIEHVNSLPRHREESKRIWHDVLFEFQQRWDQGALLALKQRLDDQPVAAEAAAKVAQIRPLLRDCSLAAIIDRAGVSRPEEGLAWLLLWQEILAAAESPPAEQQSTRPDDPLTQYELSSRMDQLRGQTVTIRGNVKECRQMRGQQNLLGIEQYYELWVRSSEANSTIPICLYCSSLPEGFPGNGQLQALDEPVTVEGTAYKIRSYQSKGDWAYCPVLLVSRIDWQPAQTQAAGGFELPRWEYLVLALAAMAGIAIYIARIAYQSSLVPKAKSAAQRENQIADNLDQLKDDPQVVTVSERLRQFAADKDS